MTIDDTQEPPIKQQSDKEYGLHLMSVNTMDDLVKEGCNLVIVALVGTNLHIRIFDNDERVIDKTESKLISGERLTALKKKLYPFPNESSLLQKEKQEIIRDARSITGHSLDSVAADRAYGYLLQIRNLDNHLMWIRSNIVLIIQGAILALLATQFTNFLKKYSIMLPVLSFFGLITAFFWWRLTEGGSFWIDFWEKKLESIEDRVTSNVEIFRNHPYKTENLKIKADFGRNGYKPIKKTLADIII